MNILSKMDYYYGHFQCGPRSRIRAIQVKANLSPLVMMLVLVMIEDECECECECESSVVLVLGSDIVESPLGIQSIRLYNDKSVFCCFPFVSYLHILLGYS